MNEQDPGIDRLIRTFLAYGRDAEGGATDDHLKIAHPNRSSQPNSPSSTTIPDEEVIALFRYKAAHFLELHAEHTSPVDLIHPLSRRLGGCCGHLRHHLRRVLIEHMPTIQAHINSNVPYERLCLACIRQRDLVERYQCTLCGGKNPTRSKLYRRTAVETSKVSHAPLIWHVPMCRRCRQVISTAFPTAPHAEEVSA